MTKEREAEIRNLVESADDVEAELLAEIDRLRAALQPFAQAANEVREVGSIPASAIFIWKPSTNKRQIKGITQQDLFNAREALEQK